MIFLNVSNLVQWPIIYVLALNKSFCELGQTKYVSGKKFEKIRQYIVFYIKLYKKYTNYIKNYIKTCKEQISREWVAYQIVEDLRLGTKDLKTYFRPQFH